MPSSHLLEFIGGLAFFFYGLATIHQGLHFFAGDRFKSMIAKTTQSPFKSFFTGILVTFFLQSSSAITVMLVGLGSSGLLSLTRAMAVALGAGIGTTFVVLIISVKSIVQYGIIVFVFGLMVHFLSSRKVIKTVGQILMGFGLLFFGMMMMSDSTAPLQTYTWIPQIFAFMEGHPWINFLIAAVITALVHSSGVVLGILISLAYAGSITFEAAFPLVLGANLGTAFTAIMVSIKAKVAGKRIAWANLLLRLGAVLVALAFLSPFIDLLHQLHGFILTTLLGHTLTPYNEIALSHFFFNLFVALVFFPLLPLGQKLLYLLIPDDPDEEKDYGPKFLDKSSLSTPSLAFAQINREILRMGELVENMFTQSLQLLNKYNLELVDKITEQDHKVDTLYKAIKFHLANIELPQLKEEEHDTGIDLITAANELESIGDTIDKHMVRLAQKKWNKGVEFSQQGWKEICEMHQETDKMMELAFGALSAQSEELASKMIHHQSYFNDRADQLKASHLLRLHEKRQESIDTSSIHLELLSLFHRININLLTMVEYLLPARKGEDKN